ncbi:MAG TPA: putative lipid II flippase FtsW [Steroidobacteraceae bacterium]|nr:putative lipid II flippase FtsW [Steroidobacteraceae bacterium]
MSRAAAAAGIRRPGLMLDPVLLVILLSILLLGLVMVTSASISIAAQHGDPFSYVKSQLLLAAGGMALALLLAAVPTELYEKHANLLLIAAALLLIAVLVPGVGHVVKGSRRWLRLGVFNLQASEVARVLVLCWVAAYSVRRGEALRTTFGGLARPLLVVGACCVLLHFEPDFGAESVLFATAFGVLFLAGARLRWVLLCVLGAACIFGLLMIAAPYRLRRITSFLDPWGHAYDSGFQLTQSLIAIGRGQWFGVGLGESVQKLFYLPEAHTDFLFAVLAEELGLVGVIATLTLFLLLVWRVLHIARLAANAGLAFQAALAASFGLWVGIQALINIGVNMGVLPTKGLTLPLMSYGRSSLLVTLAWLGLVLRVYHEAMTRTRGAASAGSRRASSAPVAEAVA